MDTTGTDIHVGLAAGQADVGQADEPGEDVPLKAADAADVADVSQAIVPLEDEKMCITLSKLERRFFGLAYRVTDPPDMQLMVTGVLQNSPAEEWNSNCDLEHYICTGDVIESVNTLSAPKAMLEELQTSQEVELRIVKTGPRWHILGVTAESMDRIEAAKGRGLQYDLHEPEHLVLAQELPHVNMIQFVMIGAAIFFPCALSCCLCSAMGWGFRFYRLTAHPMLNQGGNFVIGCTFLCSTLLYIFDFTKWKKKSQQGAAGLSIAYALCLGALMKSRFYPQLPIVVCLFHLPIFLGVLRSSALKHVNRSSFYKGTASVLLVMCLFFLAIWLTWMNLEGWSGGVRQWTPETKDWLVEQSKEIYTQWTIKVNGRQRSLDFSWDCDEQDAKNFDFGVENGIRVETDYRLTTAEKDARKKTCASIKTVWFMIYCSPVAVCGVTFVMFIFCVINGVYLNVQDTGKLEKALKHFVFMVMMMVLLMWGCISVAGSSMKLTSTVMAFCACSIFFLTVWIYLEVGQNAISAAVKESKVMRQMVAMATSDWFRAIVVVIGTPIYSSFLFVNFMNQRVRKWRGLAPKTGPLFTDSAERVNASIRYWNWSGILSKVNILSMLYWAFFIGISKITFVFLSWLNEQLSTWSIYMVLITFFITGWIMFMLPPVPGVAVYVTSGIVCCARLMANDPEGGLMNGIIVASIMCVVLKICAVCGQYYIGFCAGKQVKIQQLVGVDKVPIKAIEMILLERGLKLPKVSVLVGGPDWPTSVLCGILRLNLFQTCLGTLPVFFVSTPCVVAGAFLVGAGPANPAPCGESGGEYIFTEEQQAKRDGWQTLSSMMMMVAMAGQLLCGFLAVYFFQKVANTHLEELSKPRKEHEAIAALTRQEKELTECYAETTDWHRLPKAPKFSIFFSALFFVGSCYFLVFMDDFCFRDFSITSRICDPYTFAGLNNNVLNLWTMIGYMLHGLLIVATILHCHFSWWADKETKIAMDLRKAGAAQP